ncbi:MAG: hypothetical protein K0Q53_1134 [Massilibacillus sp.]|jgi:radical SAM-linked protein|nr:hypothetical protein [Massilibacillus sp.]
MKKFRTEITKGEELRYISHLDYASAIERSIRRTKMPVAFSEGFNPHMKISFASALALGVTSATEYMDVEFKTDVDLDEFCEKIKQQLPPGVQLLQAKPLEGKHQSLMAMIDLATYQITIPFAGDISAVEKAVAEYNQAETVMYTRYSPKKGKKEIEIKQYMSQPVKVTQKNDDIVFDVMIHVTPAGSIKPGEVLKALVDNFAMPIDVTEAFIHRIGLYSGGKTPIEL